MSLPTRTILILTMLLAIAAGLDAQDAATATADSTESVSTSTEPAAVATETATTGEPIEEPVAQSSRETRNAFTNLLRQSPDELPRLLVLDPSLMSNTEFLLAYPTLAQFLRENPQVLRHPRYYLEDFETSPPPRNSVLADVIEILGIVATFAVVAFALGWFIRTVNDQKRWNRLYRTQNEVHNKILDRFSSTEEVLAYVKSPAGSRFLEAAPIPIHAEISPKNPPLTRVIWSIQIGVVLAAAAVGMLLVSLRLDAEAAEELFALGVIAFCVGAGFVASAAISLVLSRRLGLWQDSKASNAVPESQSDPGLMR